METLLDQAGLGRKDLGIAEGQEVPMFRPKKDSPNRPYRRLWTENFDKANGTEASIEHEPVEPELKNWGEWEEWGELGSQGSSSQKYQNLEKGEEDFQEEEEEELGKAFNSRAVNYIRRVRAGEVVQLFPKMFAKIDAVSKDGLEILVRMDGGGGGEKGEESHPPFPPIE